jgi:heptaprenyl diphosphate synthase
MKTRKTVYISILVAQALVIGIIEGMFPSPFAFAPGSKLGLANLVTVIALFTLKKRDVALLIAVRLFLQMFLTGTASTFIYSAAGAVLSFIFMLLVKQLGPKRVSIIGISCIGGFFHNVGQLIVASIISETWTVLNYLPILSILGILSGALVGVTGNYLLKHVRSLEEASAIFQEVPDVNKEWIN